MAQCLGRLVQQDTFGRVTHHELCSVWLRNIHCGKSDTCHLDCSYTLAGRAPICVDDSGSCHWTTPRIHSTKVSLGWDKFTFFAFLWPFIWRTGVSGVSTPDSWSIRIRSRWLRSQLFFIYFEVWQIASTWFVNAISLTLIWLVVIPPVMTCVIGGRRADCVSDNYLSSWLFSRNDGCSLATILLQCLGTRPQSIDYRWGHLSFFHRRLVDIIRFWSSSRC